MDRRWLRAAAATPLLWAAAGGAQAETTISTAETTPVTTATANSGAPDDLTIASGGAGKPTGGTAVTLNSDNNVSIAGTVAIADANGKATRVGFKVENDQKVRFAKTTGDVI